MSTALAKVSPLVQLTDNRRRLLVLFGLMFAVLC
jgi:hypothetical protein